MAEWIKGNRYLSMDEMKNNASIIYSYLSNRGWTKNAIAALLGNMQSESHINPAIWEKLNVGHGGYGLVQWTPHTNYTNWADQNGYAWDDGYAQLKWIDEVTVSFGQWIKTPDYGISFDEFKKSNAPVGTLTSAFLKCFERADIEVEMQRQAQALLWDEYLNGATINPDTPTSSNKNKLSKLLFMAIANDII